MPHFKQKMAKGGLVLASVLLGLLLCEMGLRSIEFLKGVRLVGTTGDQYEFYRFDPKLGWSNAPGTVGTFRRREFEFPVRINGFGMRSREVNLEPSPGVLRVAVMGDSFVWGLGVPEEERFTDLLNIPDKLEVLNFGVSGYGPVQYSLMLDDVMRFKPRLLLVSFCLENDFLDNVLGSNYGYAHPYYELTADGALLLSGYPLRDIGAALQKSRARGSRLLQVVLSPWTRKVLEAPEPSSMKGLTSSTLYRARRTLSEREVRLRDQAVLVNRKIFALMREKAAARHVPIAVIVAPTKPEYGGCQSGRGSARNRNAVEALRLSLEGLGIPLIDATGEFNCGDFWIEDGHWNARGHRKISAAVGRFIRRWGPGRTPISASAR